MQMLTTNGLFGNFFEKGYMWKSIMEFCSDGGIAF
jgi:hypothetical protein